MTSYRFARPKILWGPGFASTLSIGYPLDNVKGGDEPRAGSAFDMSASGVEDAWITGRDYSLTADFRYIPQVSTASPLATGWDDGFREFLAWARNKNVLRFYPDAAGAAFVDCYLADPMQGTPDFETDGSRKLTMTLRLAPLLTPAFSSPTVGDGAWSFSAPPAVRTAAAFTCADGQTLDLIQDTSAAAGEYTLRNITYTGNGTKELRFRIARFSAYASHAIELFDFSVSTDRLLFGINFTAAVPTINIAIGAGPVTVTPRGDGSFDVRCIFSGVIAANSNAIVILPANGPVTDTAGLYVGLVRVWDAPVSLEAWDGY